MRALVPILLAVLTATLFLQGPAAQQPASPGPASVTPSLQALNLKITGRPPSETLRVGDAFNYTIELSWQGALKWVSVEAPQIEWPPALQQIEASQSVRAGADSTGQTGSKTFTYLLQPDRQGTTHLPRIDFEILTAAGEKLELQAPRHELEILPPPPDRIADAAAWVRDKPVFAIGIGFLVVVALVIAFLSGRQAQIENQTPATDPWQSLEAQLGQARALQQAGKVRDYYAELEQVLNTSVEIATGSSGLPLEQYLKGLGERHSFAEDASHAVARLKEWKFRPDTPTPEELQQLTRRVETFVKNLKSVPAEGDTVV